MSVATFPAAIDRSTIRRNYFHAMLDAPKRLTCPRCGKRVKVQDPYRGVALKQASAWFGRHRNQAGKLCPGSHLTAFHRAPILLAPASACWPADAPIPPAI
jgi:predicted nucleic acid-binding Zn ribbon protein